MTNLRPSRARLLELLTPAERAIMEERSMKVMEYLRIEGFYTGATMDPLTLNRIDRRLTEAEKSMEKSIILPTRDLRELLDSRNQLASGKHTERLERKIQALETEVAELRAKLGQGLAA